VTLMQLGTHLSTVHFDNERLLNGNGTRRKPFNPALLKLPSGLTWDFAVVARGPVREHPELKPMKDRTPVEHRLVAFGANITSWFDLYQVSTAIFLDFPSQPSLSCSNCDIFGVEDPRIWWSDESLPMLSFTQISTDPDLCRAIALVRDLRWAWPELAEVLGSSPIIPSMLEEGEQDISIELAKPNQGNIEKNWLAFYPGVHANALQNRLFHYSLNPPIVLAESAVQPDDDRVWFDQLSTPPSNRSELCMPYWHHTRIPKVHQSVPLQRLTLCPRGTCTPDTTNTVFISLGQIQKARTMSGLEYGRFVITWNVTSPFEYVSMGPEFRFNGTDDNDGVYAISMVFAPTTEETVDSFETLNIGHGFLDDDAMFGLGIRDRDMGTIIIPGKELLSGGKLCEDILYRIDDLLA